MKIAPTGKFAYFPLPIIGKAIEVTQEEITLLRNKEYCFNDDFTAVIPYVPTAEEIEAEYKSKVVERIRTRYSVEDEIAILRQKEEKPLEYQAYFDFCEQCKSEARGGVAM